MSSTRTHWRSAWRMLRASRSTVWLLALLGWGASAEAADAPGWLAEAARLATPDSVSAPAYVLLQESNVSLGADGAVHTVVRVAVRVLTRDGADACTGAVPYRTDGERVTDLHGWMIRPGGAVVTCGKDRITDVATGVGILYSEARARIVDGTGWAEPGAVFGWEAIKEGSALFSTFAWSFQGDLPVSRSRFSLTTPSGSTTRSWMFNHSPIQPVQEGPRQTWELRDLPGLEEEAERPPETSLRARLGVSVTSPGSPVRSFESWGDVARWLDQLCAPSAVSSGEVTAKARGLVAGSRTRLDSVRAVARYVQAIRYAALQLGLGSGGGYKPHLPQDVLQHSYGDCKDKSNLMRTMLASLGIRAHLVVLYSSDPAFVQEEWPTPEQFDHCIVGVEWPRPQPGEEAGPYLDGPVGSLLAFDPTSSTTALGDLPGDEQGGLVLVVSPHTRKLARLPDLSASSWLERRVEVSLAPDGSGRGSVLERSRGQAAASERTLFRNRSRDDYQKLVEKWLASGVGGARITRVATTDDSLEGRFGLDVEFEAPRLGQRVQDQLMLVRPAMVSRLGMVAQSAGQRRSPMALRGDAVRESALVTIPEGYRVDELPKPVKFESPFGAYASSCTAEGDRLLYTRSLTVHRMRVPADQYLAVRAFFDRIRAAEQSPAVLAR